MSSPELVAGLAPVDVIVSASPLTSAELRVRVTAAPLAEAFVTASALAVPPDGITVTEYPAPPEPLFTKAIFPAPWVAAAVSVTLVGEDERLSTGALLTV
jgi:hypothetical protein